LDLYVPGRPDPPELNELVRAFGALHRCSKPVLAAINGYCLGGGLEFALACDIRFAADHCVDARGHRVESFLGFPEVRLGICTGLGGATALARLVGDGLALEMLLSGDPISARRALSIGLVNEICPRDALLDSTLALARSIARNAVQAVSGFRALVRERHLTAMGSVIEREFGRFKATRPTDRAAAAGQGGA
jgi:enoyl-CoA hydratase